MSKTPTQDTDADRPVLLAVDDEADNLEFLVRAFGRDFDVHVAHDGVEALKVAAEAIPDVVVTDQRMPNMDGLEFLSQLNAICPETVRIVLTGYADVEVAVGAINIGQVVRFLTKPTTPDKLRAAVAEALEARTFDDETRQWASDLLQHQDALTNRADDLMRTLRRWKWDPLSRAGTVRALIDLLKRGRNDLLLVAVEIPWGERPAARDRRHALVSGAEKIRLVTQGHGARLYHYDGPYFVLTAIESSASALVASLRAAKVGLRVGEPAGPAPQSPVARIEAALAALDAVP